MDYCFLVDSDSPYIHFPLTFTLICGILIMLCITTVIKRLGVSSRWGVFVLFNRCKIFVYLRIGDFKYIANQLDFISVYITVSVHLSTHASGA